MKFQALHSLQRTWQSNSFRLALGFGIIVLAIMAGIFSVYYVEIVGRVSQQLDDYALRSSKRLMNIYQQQGPLSLQKEIAILLEDGIDSQTEVLILQNSDGLVWAGNAVADLSKLQPGSHLQDVSLEQEMRSFMGRVQLHALNDGRYLLAGSDLQPLTDIRNRYINATGTALVLVVVLSLAAAMAFRRLMDQRAAALRRAMHQAGKGNLHFRVPPNAHKDEFSRLEQDVNTMLEQLEQLVHGIRHVSNMVAHNLRTPLNRTLRYIQVAADGQPALRQAQLELAQSELQQLSRLFTKMLLLAEVESGIGQQRFECIALQRVLQEVLEYYEPIFVERSVLLNTTFACEGLVMGDSHLFANALSNLLDNFLKYGCDDEGRLQLDLRLFKQYGQITLQLRDHGRGVPEHALARLGSHFFRASTHQHLQGHGIGLASVRAIIQLHQGSITWRNASHGLETHITLPAASY